ncbi:MAG: DUF4326 domain-containing protein [Acidiferrobacter sp.]
MTHLILNRKTAPNTPGVYVGRPSPLGNPYALGADGDRAIVIAHYRDWLLARIDERDPVVITALLGIRDGQALICHCAPLPCHADVIAEALEIHVPILRGPRPPTYRYAGIGSRATPQPVLTQMRKVAERLAARGYTLLSGGAPGADTAFASGAGPTQEIFLPWKGFNGYPMDANDSRQSPTAEAFRVAELLHRAWSALTPAARTLMARNSHQALGAGLRSPVDFVVCWTPDGCEREESRTARTGGTGQAIALADRWGIPVINLMHGNVAMERLKGLLPPPRSP